MFRTELSIAPATDQLARSARVFTMGSCFADSIGSRLLANKVDALVNPFGTTFQPLALTQLLRAAAGEEVDWQRHLVEARGRWQSYDLHGSLGAESPVELLQHIQELVRRTGEYLRQADVVLLTLGTAWAYRLRETGQLVNNCHKQSADLFVRELLTPDEIINALAETHAYLRRINPKLRFVLTVSPVRHLKDTLPLNAVSKSVLRVATHIVSDLLPGVAYFPAYELLVDDLRDYRFYAADMLHPSEVAEDYIWEKFARTYFDAEFGRFRKEWAGVRQSLGHRPLHAAAPEHRHFLESTLEKLEQLSLRRVEVGEELRTVRTQLAALPTPRQPQPVAEIEDDEERVDIGEGSVVSTVNRLGAGTTVVAADAEAKLVSEVGQPDSTEGRLPRLSPEEFRAQRDARSGRSERGRRDGRGKNRQAQPSENEQFQVAAPAGELGEELIMMPDARAASLAALEAGLEELTPEVLSPDLVADLKVETEQDTAKKKKRRSRGGAKRTARKHALRLAAEAEGQTPGDATVEGDSTDPDNPTAAAQPSGPAEQNKSSVIVKSVPVKRGGRDNGNRVPRVPLFAAPAEEDAGSGASFDAEFPAPTIAPFEVPEVINDADDLDAAGMAEPTNEASARRKSRNRKKKKPSQGNPGSDTALSTAAMAEEPEGAEMPVVSSVMGTAGQLSGAADTPRAADAEDSAPQQSATPMPTDEATPPASEQAPAARVPRRSKGRAVSGARAEKPAVDTPVVPVRDASELRTQVAAGRLMGASASLIEPTAPLKKPAAPKKTAAAKAAPETAVAQATPKAAAKAPSKGKAPKTAAPDAAIETVAPKVAAKKPAPKSKAKPDEEVPAQVTEVVAATLEIAPAAPAAPAEVPKPAPKSKTAASKAPVKAPAKSSAKAPAKPKAPATKAATAKVASPKPAAKPKAPRKPEKPTE